MNIRKATINDLEELTMIEKICFPPAEADLDNHLNQD